MKYRVEKIIVEPYKSGPREGEYRSFDLPDGAIVLGSFTTMDGSLFLKVAVPAK